MALFIICIIISCIVLLFGLLLLLAVGPQPGIFVIMAIGALVLAGSISKLVKRKNKLNNALVNNEIQAAAIKTPEPSSEDETGRYCPYCGAEFDGNDDEVCPNCGGRTKKGRPDPQ